MSRRPIIVDTNVILAANNQDNEWGPKLAFACANRLDKVKSTGQLCVDSAELIFREYRNKLNGSRAGFGNMFYLWVMQNRRNLAVCHFVTLTPTPDHPGQFAEFPDLAPELNNRIDHSDRKFIAVANAHPAKPSILQATDSKWIGWKNGLTAVGIHVDFIDEPWLRSKYDQKMKGAG